MSIKMCLNDFCEVHRSEYLPNAFPNQNGLKQGEVSSHSF